jgi:ribosome-binding factor A
VADLLIQEIASILQKEIKDPRIGFVTLTGAELSPDLRHAKVFYTALGDDAARERSESGLKSASPYIRREVSHRLRLKVSPEIRFVFDTSLDRGERLDQLLEEGAHGPEREKS